MLENDIDECVSDVVAYIDFLDMLDSARQEVLIEMCFQLGIGGLLSFKRFLDAMRRGDFLEASCEMKDSRWYRQTPNRVEELAKIVRDGL